MFSKISERTMHSIRWLLVTGWLLMIFSLFYDPISPFFTDSNQLWSPFRVKPEECILVQTQCLELKPYPLGAPIFWGIIVPSAIFILLVFGHELWRRICPLSFLSQLPRALGWQRQIERTDSKSNKVRYEIPKIRKDSWLGKNYLYLQFSLLFIGLCSRILFINGNRFALGIWLLTTIGCAVFVGYWYGGKTWCNYFCPMAPVQKVYAEPSALLATKAHMSETAITQSMCRTIVDDKEQSACVACQNPCIDIDSERSYWEGIEKPEIKFLYFCYLGLVVGYFFYYYLYAGNWNYYYSGAWAMEANSIAKLLSPGLYLYGKMIPIPKIFAVPLVLGFFTGCGYVFGNLAERIYRSYLQVQKRKVSNIVLRHYIFSVCTFIAFNLFFLFGGRPFIRLLPAFLQETIDVIIVLLSTLWLHRNLKRDPEIYAREGLAGRFRKQLLKMEFPVNQYFAGKEIEDLNPHEIYVLVKVMPGFNKQKRFEAYKGVLREALEEGYVNSFRSLEVLSQLRTELDISDAEHRTLLEELGVEDPDLLNPDRQRNLENLVRITGYRTALERLVRLQKLNANTIKQASKSFSIDVKEEAEIVTNLDREFLLQQRASTHLQQLSYLITAYHSLNQAVLAEHRPIVSLLTEVIHRKKLFLVKSLVETIGYLGIKGEEIARKLGILSPNVLRDILPDITLKPSLVELLQMSNERSVCSLEMSVANIIEALESLMQEPNPLVQAICLYLLQILDYPLAQERALHSNLDGHPLFKDMIQTITKTSQSVQLSHFPILERVVLLFHSDFFHGLESETLIELSDRSYIKSFEAEEHLTDAGDTCRELLLLIEGMVEISRHHADGSMEVSNMLPGKVLDELEVLTHCVQSGTIIATVTPTRVLAIPVDAFDDLLDRDQSLVIKVLELETSRLKGLLSPGNADRQITAS